VWRKKLGTGVTESSSAFPKGSFPPSKPFLLFFMIIFIVTFIFSSALTTTSALEGNEVEESITENGIANEFVRGFFNEINYESPTTETSIELLYDGDTRYSWEFDEEWTGDLDYLDENGTYYDEEENIWIVSIAVNHDAPTGEGWTFIINGEEHHIQVVEPDTSVSLSGSLEFTFEPYTEGGEVSDSLTLRNEGNVPMTYELTYTDENLNHEPEKYILDTGESISLTFTYQYSTRGPEMFSPDVSLTAEHLGFLDFESEGNIGRKSQPGFGITANVFVGYEDYEQEEGVGYSVQYERSKSVAGNTYNEVTFYVYPDDEDVLVYFNEENVTFDDENVTIIPRDSDGNELDEIDFETSEELSADYAEVEITVEFLSDREDDGFIELVVGGDRYTTEIQLTETAPEPGDEEVTFVEEQSETITLGIILIGGIVIIGAGRVWLSKRKGDED